MKPCHARGFFMLAERAKWLSLTYWVVSFVTWSSVSLHFRTGPIGFINGKYYSVLFFIILPRFSDFTGAFFAVPVGFYPWLLPSIPSAHWRWSNRLQMRDRCNSQSSWLTACVPFGKDIWPCPFLDHTGFLKFNFWIGSQNLCVWGL